MRLCRPRGPGSRVLFEAGIWKSPDGDVLLYRPSKPGQFPRRRKDMDKESYWRLLGLTQAGSRLLAVHGLRHYQFASLREAKYALEWAKAAQTEPQQSALAALAMSI